METELTIQEVSQRTGLSVHTLRYYERNGLLAPVTRASNGHRRYSLTDIAWIEFLSKLKMTGMPIRQMQAYATLMRQQPDSVKARLAILEDHERAVQHQIHLLTTNLAVIQWKIQNYKTLEAKNRTSPLFAAGTPPQA